MLVEGRHFLPGADARALGHKALAVNLSDLAAMGAAPRWATLALALPALLAYLNDRGARLEHLSTRHASLEDVFVSLTGRKLRDA